MSVAKDRAPAEDAPKTKSTRRRAARPVSPKVEPITRRAAGRKRGSQASAPAAPSPAVSAEDQARSGTPFESFVVDFVRARGGTIVPHGASEYEANFDPPLARKLRRASARLVFDSERATLPRGGVFVAPGSRFGLLLLEAARGAGAVTREWLAPLEGLNVRSLAENGIVIHDADVVATELGERRWVSQLLFHFTLTLRGGMAEQDLRLVVADPRGPAFDFVELEDRRKWNTREGFPDEPVWWGETDVREGVPREEARRLWPLLVEWLHRVQEQRLERWRRRCEEARDRDLARVNAYYQTRLTEEKERRRRRAEASDEDEQATEAEIKLEWGRRVRAVRSRWEPQADVRLWGIEEVARPRIAVTWTLNTPQGRRTLAGEIDLAEGAASRIPCPVCGRLVGEFWWEGGQPVCRRCRGRGSGRMRLVSTRNEATPAPGGRGPRTRRGRGSRVEGSTGSAGS